MRSGWSSRLAACVLVTLGLAALSLPAAQDAAQPPPQSQSSAVPQSAPNMTAMDIPAGRKIFDGNCSRCHGADGAGTDGPDIRNVTSRMNDAALLNTIRRGVPGTGMPAFGDIKESEAGNVIAYIHTLNTISSGPVSGNPEKGRAIFAEKNCAACHIVSGQGGGIGPELTRIGAMRGSPGLREAVVNPGANLPEESNVLDRGRFKQYLMFRAVEKDGHVVEGMRASEDTFMIVLKDGSGKLHSLDKGDLRSLEKEPGKSLMPSFKSSLSDEELDDLVAYLAGLKGGK